MTLGPTILLPPLYEIQRNIQQIKDKYGGNMLLNVLDRNSDETLLTTNDQPSPAPRVVVFGFLSMLSEQLFRFNMLKTTIKDEKKLKMRIADTILGISIVILLLIFFFVTYLMTKRFQRYTILFTKLESGYYIGAITLIVIYLLFTVIVMYQKNKVMYDKYYEVDTLFNGESSIQHILSMLTPEKDSSVFSQLKNRKYACKGINPLIGYFIKINRNFDVKYTFHPDPINEVLQTDEDNEAMRTRKVFNFTDKKNPYLLTNDSLLDVKNLPATVVKDNMKYVDPFIQGNNLLGDPEIFKKKLQKYDIYGQYSRITDAIVYFESLLSRDDIDGANINQDVVNKLKDKLKKLLRFDEFIVTNEIGPCEEFLSGASIAEKIELITLDHFAVVVMARRIDYAYYNFRERTGYLFNKDSLQNCVFILKKRHDIYSQNLDNKDGGYSFVRQNEDMHLHIGTQERPRNLSTLFSPQPTENSTPTPPSFSAFEVTVDVTTGKIESTDGESIKVLKNSGINSAKKPTLVDVFGHISSTYGESIKSSMFIYKISSTEYVRQSRESFLDLTFRILKPYLYDSILNTIGEIDPSYSVVKIDNTISNDVIEYIDFNVKQDAKLIKSHALDFMYDLPAKIEEKAAQITYESKLSDEEQKLFQKYIPYPMFMMQVRNMNKDEFMDKFLYNIDVLRHTSEGLKKIHDKYDFGRQIFSKNQQILEFTFILVILLGMFEIFHQAALQYLSYGCRNISFFDREDEIRKEFKIYNYDNSDTKMMKQHVMDKKLGRLQIRRNKDKSRRMFFIALLIVIYLISVAYIYTWKERSRNLFNYNNYVLESNGNRIVIDSEEILQHMTHLIVKKQQFLFLKETYTETGDVDELYHLLQKHSLKEKAKVDIDEETQLRVIYNKLISIVESFHKCNILMENNNQNLPFPVFESTMYLIIMIITTIVILYGIFQLHPARHYYNLKNWSKIQELMRKDIEIDPKSFGFACDEPPQKKTSLQNAMTYMSAATLLIVGALFSVSLFQNANSFGSSLYNSPMFRDLKCYNL